MMRKNVQAAYSYNFISPTFEYVVYIDIWGKVDNKRRWNHVKHDKQSAWETWQGTAVS